MTGGDGVIEVRILCKYAAHLYFSPVSRRLGEIKKDKILPGSYNGQSSLY